MKVWFIIAVVVMTAGYPTEQQQQGTREHQEVRKQAKQVPPPPLVVQPPAPVPQPATQVKQYSRNNDPEDIWYEAVSPGTWPNWAVVIAALAAVLVAVRTLREMKDQAQATRLAAEAARDSVRLQGVAMQQWLVIEGWTTSYDDRDNSIKITARVKNPTALPLIILGHEDRVGGLSFAYTSNRVLAPNDHFLVEFQTDPLSEEARRGYLGLGTSVFVSVIVNYRDCFKVIKSQEFKGLLKCWRGGTAFTEFSGRQQNQ
jgi:hypothetical protein